MTDLRQKWQAFLYRAFPSGYGGVEVNNVCVTSVDTFAAGCFDTYVKHGRLDPERIRILRECHNDLLRALPSLTGEAKDYFSELASLADEVLRQLNKEA